MDCRPPGSFVQGILQARILEWVAISSSRGIFLLQGIFVMQVLNLHLLHLCCLLWQANSLSPAPPRKPDFMYIQVLVPIPTSIWPNTQLIFHPDMWHMSLNPSRFSTSTKMRGLSLSLAAWNCSPNSQSTHGAPPDPPGTF